MYERDEFARAAEALENASTVGLVCHVGPDGDALGSMLGLRRILAMRGIEASASFPDPFLVPPHYAFLPGTDELVPPENFPSEPDVLVTFDCGSIDRLMELEKSARGAGVVVVVDHHASNDSYGDINVIDPDAAASALIVYRMAREMNWEIDRNAAICLYTGIASDTGRFQFRNTNREVFEAAADLASLGVPVDFVSRTVFEEHKTNFLRFLGRVLSRIELDSDRKLVYSWFDQSDLRDHGVGIEETESVIDFVRQAKEADVALLVKESAPGEVKVSLRTLGTVDVSEICKSFGGGGHKMAAGFTSDVGIEETIARVKGALDSVPRLERPGIEVGR